MNLVLIAERKAIAEAGWDASYKFRTSDSRIIPLIDRSILNERALNEDLLKQTKECLARP